MAFRLSGSRIMAALRLSYCMLFALVGGLAPWTGGCVQDAGDVDRRQAGLLRKSLFDGEWYMRRTVIDVPYDAGYTFVGETDEMVRVRWEIQRDYLLARRAHPFVAGTNGAAPLAVFKIEAHVDAIREYNPLTGEQSNVIAEDQRDRMWFDREYIRVDWSRNVGTNFAFAVDGLELEPVAWTLEERADPDRMLVGLKQADGTWLNEQDHTLIGQLEKADYLDIVTKVLVKPEQVDFEDWDGTTSREPACWYYLNYDCAPAVIAVRNSFLKVDAAHTDYEPLAYPDNRIARDQDGAAVYVRWDEDGNLVRSSGTSPSPEWTAAQDFAPKDPYAPSPKSPVRLPFFDKFGFFRTERFNFDPSYGELQSQREQYIQRWNIWNKSHDAKGEPLAYAQRGTRSIVYYLSPDFPSDLMAAANKAVDQWNDAFVETTQALSGTATTRIFELRPNSRTVDPTTGHVLQRGEAIGDLRYSHLYLVLEPTRAGLLGYGPAAADPLTGEIISADAYVYLDAVKLLAARGRDVVGLIHGTIDPVDFALGEHVQGYLAKLAQSQSERTGVARSSLEAFAHEHPIPSPAKSKSAAVAAGKKFGTAGKPSAKAGTITRPAGWSDARLQALRGSQYDQWMSGDPQVVALRSFGTAAGKTLAQLPGGLQKGASPTTWATPGHRRRSLDRLRFFAERNMMKAEFFDDAAAGLATSLIGEDPEKIAALLAEAIFRSVAEHEIGHTLGLRHNFEGSTDALNYHPEFWALRGNNPQPLEGMSQTQTDARMREYQYSSIMDYAGRFNADTAGLGHYDRAAIKFGYGQLVEVFEEAPNEPLLALTELGEGEFARLFSLDQVLQKFRHYTSLPKIFGGVQGFSSRRNVPYTDTTASLMAPGAEPSLEAQLTGRAPWQRWEVPYRFCSDEYLFGTATCHAYDLGADAWEIVTDAVDRYWNYYWFNSFQRDQVFFDEWSFLDAMYWRYFGFVHNAFQHWVFEEWFTAPVWDSLAADSESYGVEDKPWRIAADGGLAFTAAAREGLTFLQQVLAAPEPGSYWYDFDEGYYWSFSPQSYPICLEEWARETDEYCADSVIDLGEGRYFLTVYDWESGYTFYERLKWIGSFYDKLLALETLTNPDTYFVGIDTSQSVDQWALSMYLAFPEELHRIFAGIAADRFDLFAGHVNEDWYYQPPNPFETDPIALELQADGPVDPQTSFTIQLYGLWYSMALLNANFDNRFNDLAHIWVEGHGDGFVPAPGAGVITFANPLNGRVYKAIDTNGEPRVGVGWALLDQANKAAEIWAEAQADPETDPGTLEYLRWRLENFVSNIEVVRGLYQYLGMMSF